MPKKKQKQYEEYDRSDFVKPAGSASFHESDESDGGSDDHRIRTVLLALMVIVIVAVFGIYFFGPKAGVQSRDLPAASEITKGERKEVITEIVLNDDRELTYEEAATIRGYIAKDSLVGYNFTYREQRRVGERVNQALEQARRSGN